MTVRDEARKWARRKEDRPGELVDAALAEFTAKGFVATRLEDVARRAGVSKGTVYRYFDGKDALFEAVLKSLIAPVLDQVETLVDDWPGSNRDLLKTVLTRMYGHVIGSDYPAVVRVMLAEGPGYPHLFEVYHREVVARGQGILGRILERGVAEGEFRDGPAARMPLSVIGPAIAALIWQITFQPIQPIETDRFLEAHLDLLLNGLSV